MLFATPVDRCLLWLAATLVVLGVVGLLSDGRRPFLLGSLWMAWQGLVVLALAGLPRDHEGPWLLWTLGLLSVIGFSLQPRGNWFEAAGGDELGQDDVRDAVPDFREAISSISSQDSRA